MRVTLSRWVSLDVESNLRRLGEEAARAAEGGAELACCVAASAYPGEEFAGAGNLLFDPHGEPVRTPDDRFYELEPRRGEGLLVDPLEAFLPVARVDLVRP